MKLYLSNINFAPTLREYWQSLYSRCHSEGKFQIDIARRFSKNRFVARTGVWPNPFPLQILDGFEVPNADLNFSMTFAEVTNERAQEIQKLIRETGSRVALFYSGGIDSVICLSALLQNLSSDELKHLDICMSSESIIENPAFFEKYILGRLSILDSSKVSYRHIEAKGGVAITCDQGDSIFGTEMATEFYYRYQVQNPEIEFHKFEDQLIEFFQADLPMQFGRTFYGRVVENLSGAPVEIRSLHDFFWWIIFNLKYMDCALRGPVFYYGGEGNRKNVIQQTMINWFHSENYQKWSLVNNNNGQKIRGHSAASYKWAGRQYIYAFDKNEWYFRHKLKLSSLYNLSHRSENRLQVAKTFALDQNFEVMFINNFATQQFVETYLT